jgi:hypothetical protein
MANIFTNFLNSISGDLANTNLKDYQHANRLFVQNFYRLAPKHGFLYFVRFRLNPKVADGEAWRTSRQDLELGMLVKKCDLPKITFDGGVLNVYNKKQPYYSKVTYQPLNMTLHDDNKGLVREFWQMYYQYHSADSYYGGNNAIPGTVPTNPKNRYQKPPAITQQQLLQRANPADSNFINTSDPARYGLDVSTGEPLIRSIEIYQLSRKQFFLHTLVNPKIRSWNMDTLASDAKATLEHNVTIEYEGVYMGQGKVTRFSPSGWTDLHYDLDPSPIGGIFGRFDGGLYGPNGLIADGTTLFQDLQDMKDNPSEDPRQGLDILLRGARLISNANNLNQDLVRAQVRDATISSVGFGIVDSTTGSVLGLSVPRPSFSEFATEAKSRNNISPPSNNTTETFVPQQSRVTSSASITQPAIIAGVNSTVIVNNAIDSLQRNPNAALVDTYNSLATVQKTELFNLANTAVAQIFATERNADIVSAAAARLILGGGTVAYYVETNGDTLDTSDESTRIVATTLTSLLTNLELKRVYDKLPESLKTNISRNASKAANQVLIDGGGVEAAAVAAKTLWTFELVKFAVSNFESLNNLF